MKYEISVSLTLAGLDLQPDEITAKLKISPSKVWHKGDLIHPKGKICYLDNGWSLKSHLDSSCELEDHIQSIFEHFQHVWAILKEICSLYKTEISCVIYVSEQVPSIHFNPEILEQIHQLNASLDVDLYVLPENSSQNEQQLLSYDNVSLV